MGLFEPSKVGSYPRRCKDMSLDFKLMFVYHGSMMVLFIVGGVVSARQELIFAGVLLLVFTSISIRHRRSASWRWQGVKPKNLIMAVFGIGLMGVFLYAVTPMFPPSNPRFLPWFLAGFGIGAFNVLQTLRLVHVSEAAFLADCHEPGNQIEQAAPTDPTEPPWHRVAKVTFKIVFVIVWLGFFASYFYSGSAFRDGSPDPTPTQTEALTDNGQTVYITRGQKILCDRLELFSFVGVPLVLLSGFLLHFLGGVKLDPNAPTLPEILARKSPRS